MATFLVLPVRDDLATERDRQSRAEPEGARGWLPRRSGGPIVRYASITEHFSELAKGVIDTKDLVYFATLLLIGLFLTLRSVESVRWR